MPLSLQESYELALDADFRKKAVAAFLRFSGTIGGLSDTDLTAAEPTRTAAGLRAVSQQIFRDVRTSEGQLRLALVLASYADLDPADDASILTYARTAIVAMVPVADVVDP